MMPPASHDCSLAILAGPKDSDFLALTATHIVRQHAGLFRDRILVIDDLPGGNGDGMRSQSIFHSLTEDLVGAGVFTTITRLSTVSAGSTTAAKHFGNVPRHVRDYRGIPLFGWVAGIEASDCRFHVHCDSDILIHRRAGRNWVEEGLRLLTADSRVLCVAPHPGPGREDGYLFDQPKAPTLDANGNLAFEDFSSRRFLIDRKRFEELLPLSLSAASKRLLLRSLISGRSAIQNWESLVSEAMRRLGMVRVHLSDASAWALHAADHGRDFIELLPAIISCVENGRFPQQQAGRYNVHLEAWKHFVEEDHGAQPY